MATGATAAGQTGAHDVEASLGQRCLSENGAAMNWEAIDAWLASATDNQLAAYRELLNSANAALKTRFLNDTAVEQLVADRATLIDKVIVAAWNKENVNTRDRNIY